MSCRFDILGGTVDDLKRRFVAGLVVVVPRRHSVMAKQNAFRLRIVLDQLLDLQADIEPRTLPRDINDIVTIDLFRQSFLIDRCGNGDDRIRDEDDRRV